MSAFFERLSQHRWHMHSFQTYGLRFTRGTQRLQTVFEIATMLSVACLTYLFMKHLMLFVVLRIGLSLVTVGGLSWLNICMKVVKILGFAAGACVGQLVAVAGLRWWYPYGTGYGRARLHGAYLSKVMHAHAHDKQTRVLNVINVSLSEFKPRFLPNNFNECVAMLSKNNGAVTFLTDLCVLKDQDSACYRDWLLDNMIDAVRRLKNVLKRVDRQAVLSGQAISHADTIQALIAIVQYMKLKPSHALDEQVVQTFVYALNRFMLSANDSAQQPQCYACFASIALAMETLLAFEATSQPSSCQDPGCAQGGQCAHGRAGSRLRFQPGKADEFFSNSPYCLLLYSPVPALFQAEKSSDSCGHPGCDQGGHCAHDPVLREASAMGTPSV